MIISMRLHATKEEVANVCDRIKEFGYKVHSIEGEQRVVIGAVGVGDVTPCLESLEAMPGVEKAVRISAPYKFVSREFRSAKTEIEVAGAIIGRDEFVVMAGPCSVESEAQILESAEIVARAGAKLLRGGAFKPRTSPYDFQGLEIEGLKLLDKARRATGLTPDRSSTISDNSSSRSAIPARMSAPKEPTAVASSRTASPRLAAMPTGASRIALLALRVNATPAAMPTPNQNSRFISWLPCDASACRRPRPSPCAGPSGHG